MLGLIAGPLGMVYAGMPLGALIILLLSVLAAAFCFAYPASVSSDGLLLLKLGIAVVCSFLAYRVARSASPRPHPWYARWYGLMTIGVVIALLFLLFRLFLFEGYRVSSASMAPTAEPGDNLLIAKQGYAAQSVYGMRFGVRVADRAVARGEYVAFISPTQNAMFAMRVVGVPGDAVAYRNRRLYINGVATRGPANGDYLDGKTMRRYQRYQEKIGEFKHEVLDDIDVRAVPPPDYDAFKPITNCTFGENLLECTVPPGHYFVMGDNRDNSFDSRYWGFVSETAITGKVIGIFH
ncbi:signal peptidase I [Massilia sp. CF038]|uniref:signal peptidase I n=1 Tax=Massilia sp. CF038 TaxID=1881045 RepID=UPI000932FB33|nr:signal peptidase I [Massilia sp. CF038]